MTLQTMVRCCGAAQDGDGIATESSVGRHAPPRPPIRSWGSREGRGWPWPPERGPGCVLRRQCFPRLFCVHPVPRAWLKFSDFQTMMEYEVYSFVESFRNVTNTVTVKLSLPVQGRDTGPGPLTAAGSARTSTAGTGQARTPRRSGPRSWPCGCPGTGCCPRAAASSYPQSAPISVYCHSRGSPAAL